MSQISKCPNMRVLLTYWEAPGEVSELSYKSLLYSTSVGSYCTSSISQKLTVFRQSVASCSLRLSGVSESRESRSLRTMNCTIAPQWSGQVDWIEKASHAGLGETWRLKNLASSTRKPTITVFRAPSVVLIVILKLNGSGLKLKLTWLLSTGAGV